MQPDAAVPHREAWGVAAARSLFRNEFRFSRCILAEWPPQNAFAGCVHG